MRRYRTGSPVYPVMAHDAVPYPPFGMLRSSVCVLSTVHVASSFDPSNTQWRNRFMLLGKPCLRV